MIEPPNGWGDDALTSYLDNCRLNHYASYHRNTDHTSRLIEIDRIASQLLENFENPRPQVPILFFTRSHAALRCAFGCIMAGHAFESNSLLRLALEHCAYGAYIGSNVERWEIWRDRDGSRQARQRFRVEFTNGNVKRDLKRSSNALGLEYENLYEGLIDGGAHPNASGFRTNLSIRHASDGSVHFESVQLHDGGPMHRVAFRKAAEVGACVLSVMQAVYGDRFTALQLSEPLAAFRQGLNLGDAT